MRAIVQRVSEATVKVEARNHASIGPGLLVYLGVANDDTADDAGLLADKTRHLRIFDDDAGQLNRDVSDVGGAVMAVSAFTVLGDARKGRRPAYTAAARPELAAELYDRFCCQLESTGIQVLRGVFRAYMEVVAVNDGPVCILLDSRKTF